MFPCQWSHMSDPPMWRQPRLENYSSVPVPGNFVAIELPPLSPPLSRAALSSHTIHGQEIQEQQTSCCWCFFFLLCCSSWPWRSHAMAPADGFRCAHCPLGLLCLYGQGRRQVARACRRRIPPDAGATVLWWPAWGSQERLATGPQPVKLAYYCLEHA